MGRGTSVGQLRVPAGAGAVLRLDRRSVGARYVYTGGWGVGGALHGGLRASHRHTFVGHTLATTHKYYVHHVEQCATAFVLVIPDHACPALLHCRCPNNLQVEESLQRMHASANWSEAEKTGRVLPSRVRHGEGPRGGWVVGRAWGVQVLGRAGCGKGQGGAAWQGEAWEKLEGRSEL